MSIMPTESTKLAYGFGKVTLMGVTASEEDYPIKRGNSFGVWTTEEPPCHYHIKNMRLEDLKKLIERGIVSWPIEIFVLDKTCALITDPRVPVDWYF